MYRRPGKPGARGAASSREPRAPGEAATVEVGSAVVSTPPRAMAELAPRRARSTGNIRSIWSKKPHPAMHRARSTSGTKIGICAHATPGELQHCGLQPRAGSTKTPCYPTPCCTRNTPLPCMEPMGQFDMWRDYLGLADMVAALFRDHEDLEDPSVLSGPLAPCAKTASCARTPPRAKTVPCAKTAPRARIAPRAWPASCARIAPRAWPAPCARPALRGGGLPPCSFCQHNGEAPKMYRSHSLRDAQGRLQCPVLRNYVCPQCGATQDWAHTRRYCPRTHRGYTSVYTRPARPRSAGRRQWNTRM